MKPVPLEMDYREIEPETVMITLAGRLMLGPEGQRLEELVADLLERGYRRFVFEMSGLTHIDSTGIGRCIASLNKIMPLGGKLHMVAATRPVREGFRVTHLDRVFRFFDDLATAQTAF